MKVGPIIREYLEKETLFSKQIDDSNLEFGFLFSFPPGKKKAPMQVLQPKNKDFIIITLGVQIPDPYIKALNSLDQKQKNQYYYDIRKFLLRQNFLFKFDIKRNRYQISDQVYLNDEEGISKNDFFTIIRKIYNSVQYCNIILAEYCSGKIDDKDLSDDFSPSLYS